MNNEENKCYGCGNTVPPDRARPDHYYCQCGFMWVSNVEDTTWTDLCDIPDYCPECDAILRADEDGLYCPDCDWVLTPTTEE